MKKFILVLTLLLVGCIEYVSPTPVVTQTESPQSTETFSVPTATVTPSPSPTSSCSPTFFPLVDPTPTQIVGTPSIIEVTPLGGYYGLQDHWQGLPDGSYYLPYGTTNIRSCADISCDIIERVAAGVRVDVYSKLYKYYQDEEWLCLTDLEASLDKETVCSRAIALLYKGSLLGNLVLP